MFDFGDQDYKEKQKKYRKLSRTYLVTEERSQSIGKLSGGSESSSAILSVLSSKKKVGSFSRTPTLGGYLGLESKGKLITVPNLGEISLVQKSTDKINIPYINQELSAQPRTIRPEFRLPDLQASTKVKPFDATEASRIMNKPPSTTPMFANPTLSANNSPMLKPERRAKHHRNSNFNRGLGMLGSIKGTDHGAG